MGELVLVYPLLVLATYRVWRIIAVDQITEPIRSRYMWRDGPVWSWVMDMVVCPWCLGWWLSGIAAMSYTVVWIVVCGGSWWWLVAGVALLWPAVSTGVGITSTIVDRLSSDG